MNARWASLLLLSIASTAFSASPTAWEMTAYQDFIKGRFTGVAVDAEGRLRLAPKLETLWQSGQPAVWCMAPAPGGVLYLGTGHRGRLFRLAPGGTAEELFIAPEPEIFAVTVDASGAVYFGTSPSGKVYKVAGGKVAEFFDPKSAYIWSLLPGPGGSLYVATGNEGKVFRVDALGNGEVYYETGQSHVTSLALDSQQRLLAGTEPNGMIYRISEKDRAFVLHRADLPEIRSLVPASDGSIYAVAMGGSLVRQQGLEGGAVAPTISTTTVASPSATITVTDEAAQGGVEVKPKPATPAAATASPAAVPLVEFTGVDKSAIYQIHPDHSVETLWSSKEENAYDMAVTAAGLLFSTDHQGRVYRLNANRKVTLLSETRESEALRLMPGGGGVLVATSNLGKLFRLSDSASGEGEFESPVHDASSVARWGRLSWQQQSCQGCSVLLRTRTGNNSRPDKTWSEWSGALTDAQGSLIPSPNARYVQWKAEFRGAGAASPALDSVRLAYLPQNSTPVIRSVNVSTQVAAAGVKPQNAGAQAAASYSITVTDSGEAGASSLSGTPSQPLTRASDEQILITWHAEDGDGDRLSYSLHFRGEQETEWKLLKANLTEAQHAIDAEALADGRYYFRVTASDAVSNPAANARQAELVSAPVLVDRTPPAVLPGAPVRSAAAVELKFQAADAASPLKSCEYSIDAGPWTPLAPEDGIIDSRQESFLLRLDPVPAGEHLLVIRVYDSAHNAGLARVVLR